MLTQLFTNPLMFLVYILSLVTAITIHEFSHAFIADRLGDPTARLKGRLTLNPLAHLDPIGTIMLFVARVGWGKPVPVDPFNFREPKKDSALVSLAGPVSNLLLALALSLIIHFFPASYLSAVLIVVIIMNVSLAFFNLIPISPLDGFSIVEGILPEDLAAPWHSFQSFGIIILIFLLVMPGPGISGIISPPVNFVLKLLLPPQMGIVY